MGATTTRTQVSDRTAQASRSSGFSVFSIASSAPIPVKVPDRSPSEFWYSSALMYPLYGSATPYWNIPSSAPSTSLLSSSASTYSAWSSSYASQKAAKASLGAAQEPLPLPAAR